MIISPELTTFLIAMSPIGELRASIPFAINFYQLPFWSAFFFSILGNLVPPILIFLGLKTLSEYLSRKIYFFNRFFAWLFSKAKGRHKDQIEKWKELGLLILVAIPLPFTGAWTGALIAFVFGFSFRKAISLIALGIIIAGAIVSLATFFGIFLEKHFGWQAFLGLLIISGFLFWYWQKKKNERSI